MVLRSAVRGILQQVLTQQLKIAPERLTEELMALCMRYLTGRGS